MPEPQLKIKLLGPDKAKAAQLIPKAKIWLASLTERRLKAKMSLLTEKKMVGLDTLIILQSSTTKNQIWIRKTGKGLILPTVGSPLNPTGCSADPDVDKPFAGRWRVIVELDQVETTDIVEEDGTGFVDYTESYRAILYNDWVEAGSFEWQARYKTQSFNSNKLIVVDPDTGEVIPPRIPTVLDDISLDVVVLDIPTNSNGIITSATTILATGFKDIAQATDGSCDENRVSSGIVHYSSLTEPGPDDALPFPYIYRASSKRSVFVNGQQLASGTSITVRPNNPFDGGGYTHIIGFPLYPFTQTGGLIPRSKTFLVQTGNSNSPDKYSNISAALVVSSGESIEVSFGTLDQPNKYGTSPTQPGTQHNYTLSVLSGDDVYATVTTSSGIVNSGVSGRVTGKRTSTYTKADIDSFRASPSPSSFAPEPGLVSDFRIGINESGASKLKITIYSGNAATGSVQLAVVRQYPHVPVTTWGSTEEIVNVPLPPSGGKIEVEVPIPQYVASETKMVPAFNTAFDELRGTSQRLMFRHSAINGGLDGDFKIVIESDPPIYVRVDDFRTAPIPFPIPREFSANRTFLDIPGNLGELPQLFEDLNEVERLASLDRLDAFEESKEPQLVKEIALNSVRGVGSLLNFQFRRSTSNPYGTPATKLAFHDTLGFSGEGFVLGNTIRFSRIARSGDSLHIVSLKRSGELLPGTIIKTRRYFPNTLFNEVTVEKVDTYKIETGSNGQIQPVLTGTVDLQGQVVTRSEQYHKELESQAVTNGALATQLLGETVVVTDLAQFFAYIFILAPHSAVNKYAKKQRLIVDHPELTEPRDTTPSSIDKPYKLSEDDEALLNILQRTGLFPLPDSP